jgi:hypothetical protein
MRTSNVPLNSNLRDAHIVGDFGGGVSGSVCKIDLLRPSADDVQYGCELIQALLAIEDLILSANRSQVSDDAAVNALQGA